MWARSSRSNARRSSARDKAGRDFTATGVAARLAPLVSVPAKTDPKDPSPRIGSSTQAARDRAPSAAASATLQLLHEESGSVLAFCSSTAQ